MQEAGTFVVVFLHVELVLEECLPKVAFVGVCVCVLGVEVGEGVGECLGFALAEVVLVFQGTEGFFLQGVGVSELLEEVVVVAGCDKVGGCGCVFFCGCL